MSPLIAIFLLFVIIFATLFSLLKRRTEARKVLERCGFAVVPSSNFLIGNLDIMRDERTPFRFQELRQKYGKTYAIMQGAFPTIVTSDIDLIQEICMKKFRFFHSRMMDPTSGDPDESREVHVFAARGERWKRIRSVTSPALSTQNLRNLFTTVCDSVDRFIGGLLEENNNSIPTELHRCFQNLTYDVISRCALGRKESRQKCDPNLKLLLRKFSAYQAFNPFSITSLPWCLPEWNIIFQLYNSLRSKIRSFFHLRIDPLAQYSRNLRDISELKQKSEENFDFLQFLKNVEDNEWTGWKTINDVQTDVNTIKIAKKMIPEEIVAQMRFLSTAGFDTTANTLTYLTYLLAIHPDKQQKLRDEIDECDELCFDVINRLEYLQWCIAETLRLFPHASLLQSRRCVEDCEAGIFEFKRGINIVFDTWSLHHDREVWGENAEEFRPERFADRNSEQLRSWTPFGVGPRMCIGMRFALLETKAAMFQLMKNFRILKAPRSDRELRLSRIALAVAYTAARNGHSMARLGVCDPRGKVEKE